MDRKRSFGLVAAPHTRLMILGSLPGDASLALGQYYGHPRNQFWRLLEPVVGEPLQGRPYDERIAALLAAGIGLWDSVGSAVRRGSLDAAIRAHEANPVAAGLSDLPALRAVAFNGKTAYAIGAPLLAGLPCPLTLLPSSSPANAMRFEAKQAAWGELRAYLL